MSDVSDADSTDTVARLEARAARRRRVGHDRRAEINVVDHAVQPVTVATEARGSLDEIRAGIEADERQRLRERRVI